MFTFCSLRLLRQDKLMNLFSKFRFSSKKWNSTTLKNTQNKYSKSDKPDRFYYYNVDTRGRLYLSDVYPKNMTTSLKDKKFLDFFYKNMRINNTGISPETRYVSICANEYNFIFPDDNKSALVFTDFINKNTNAIDQNYFLNDSLIFASGLLQPFDPKELFYDSVNQRLYHKITNHKNLKGELGLFHPFIAVNICDHIDFDSFNTCYLTWNQEKYKIANI